MISAGSRRGSSHALVPWNREQAWSASGPSGGHAFSGRTDSNRLNTEQQIGHASVTRSRTLVLSTCLVLRPVCTYAATLCTMRTLQIRETMTILKVDFPVDARIRPFMPPTRKRDQRR